MSHVSPPLHPPTPVSTAWPQQSTRAQPAMSYNGEAVAAAPAPARPYLHTHAPPQAARVQVAHCTFPHRPTALAPP
eukprot:3336131-Prorocentrum_lima.AAC.1